MPSRSSEVDPFTRHPGQLARDRVEAIRSPVPDALAETVRKIGGRFGIRNIRVRLARAKDESSTRDTMEAFSSLGGAGDADAARCRERPLCRLLLTDAELIGFCRDKLPHFAVPKTIVFGPLPTTSTGKVQKYTLRERARTL